jgi:hypothetical protein
MCAPDSMTSKQISFFDCSIDGFYETNKDGKTVIRAFEFAKIETTSECLVTSELYFMLIFIDR